jgi:hypothetical protein
VAVLERRGQAQHVVPLAIDEVLVGDSGQQRPGVRVPGEVVPTWAEPVGHDPPEVADARREHQPDQVEEGEVDQGDPACVDRVFGDREIGCIAEDFVQHVVGFPVGRDDDLCAVGGVLVGDVGVGRDAFVDEISGQVPGGERPPAAHREPLPVRGGQGS